MGASKHGWWGLEKVILGGGYFTAETRRRGVGTGLRKMICNILVGNMLSDYNVFSREAGFGEGQGFAWDKLGLTHIS